MTVQRTLVKDIHTSFSYEETADKGQMYGLISLDLTQIKPNYDAMVKGGTLRISDDGYAQGENILPRIICTVLVPCSDSELYSRSDRHFHSILRIW